MRETVLVVDLEGAVGLAEVIGDQDQFALHRLADASQLVKITVDGKRFHETVRREGVVLAGGVLKDLRDKDFRIGHMGNMGSSEILAIVGAIEKGLSACGYEFQRGLGLTAAGEVLTEL